MAADYLAAVESTVLRLQRISSEAQRQIAELSEFVRGERRSNVPLGKLFLMNVGSELEELGKDIEQWIK